MNRGNQVTVAVQNHVTLMLPVSHHRAPIHKKVSFEAVPTRESLDHPPLSNVVI